MKVRAKSKYVKISTLKVMPLARTLRGLPIEEALKITDFTHSKAAAVIGKTLKSAIANVRHNAKQPTEKFRVEAVVIESGPGMRRFWSRSRGMARPIRKRTSHVEVILTDD